MFFLYGFGTLLRLSFIAIQILRAMYARHSLWSHFLWKLLIIITLETCEIRSNSCSKLESCGLKKLSDSLVSGNLGLRILCVVVQKYVQQPETS